MKSVNFSRKPLDFHIDLLCGDGELISNQKVVVGRGEGSQAARRVALGRSCHCDPALSFCFSYYYVTESLPALKIQHYKLIVMLPH